MPLSGYVIGCLCWAVKQTFSQTCFSGNDERFDSIITLTLWPPLPKHTTTIPALCGHPPLQRLTPDPRAFRKCQGRWWNLKGGSSERSRRVSSWGAYRGTSQPCPGHMALQTWEEPASYRKCQERSLVQTLFISLFVLLLQIDWHSFRNSHVIPVVLPYNVQLTTLFIHII